MIQSGMYRPRNYSRREVVVGVVVVFAFFIVAAILALNGWLDEFTAFRALEQLR